MKEILKKFWQWLKVQFTETDFPNFFKSKDKLMVVTKNRGPKKNRYLKLKPDLGRRVKYNIPYEGESNG